MYPKHKQREQESKRDRYAGMHMLLTNLEELRVEKQASCGGKPWWCEDFKVKVIYILKLF